ncbi:MAG: hypothetical protein IK058_00985 [Bacteroidales bacterium]|nr:hypothetical protein [Bacteroidales bacterium]
MMRRALTLILLLSAVTMQAQEKPWVFTAAWWNVENLFDTRDDPQTNDDDFTPQGDLHWTPRKMWAKLQGIHKTLTMMDLPDVVGLAEVENRYVLRSLCEGTPLNQAGYRYIHYDSPDRRGIDVALLYRKERFRVLSSRAVSVSDSTEDFYTRDLLVVEGVTHGGDTVCLVLNHWPSKRGGDEAERHRVEIARTVRRLMNELHERHPKAAVVAMGDMNSTIGELPITQGMGFGSDTVNAEGIRNLTLKMPKEWGSHKYQGVWDYIDQVFLLAGDGWLVGDLKLMRYDHLLTEEGSGPGMRPKRTNRGPKYEGGLSDHLPLLLRLKRR